MIELPLMWLAIIVIAILGELHSPGLFFFLSVAGAATLALGVQLMGQPFEAQVAVFMGGWALVFWLLRRYVAGALKTKQHKTNVEALIGVRARVTERIEPFHVGRVRIGGELWVACATNQQEMYEVGTLVEVIAVVGSHVVVKKVL
jgi:membrane protein implicated in regulation of membrane protease activity